MTGLKLTDTGKLSALMVNAMVKCEEGTGVGIGCKASWSGSGDNCNVATGMVFVAGELKSVPKTSALSVGTRDATNPRRNIIVYDYSADAVAVVAGTPAAYPNPPALADDNDVLLSIVYLPASGGAALTADSFTDSRVFCELEDWANFLDDFACLDTTNMWGTTLTGTGAVTLVNDSVVKVDAPAASDTALLYAKGDGNLWSSATMIWMRFRVKVDNNTTGTGLLSSKAWMGFYDSSGTPFLSGTGTNNAFGFEAFSTTWWAFVTLAGVQTLTTMPNHDEAYHTVDVLRTKTSSGYELAVMMDRNDVWYEVSSVTPASANLRPGFKVEYVSAANRPTMYLDRMMVVGVRAS